ADEAVVEEPDDRGYDALITEAASAQIGLHLQTQAGQDLGEVSEGFELGEVTLLGPVGMVAILLAAALIPAGGLDMAAGIGADPHITPCRRNGEGADAGNGGLVGARAVGRAIGKTAAFAQTFP